MQKVNISVRHDFIKFFLNICIQLIGHETFSDAQLFFLLSFRQMCRSFTPEDVYFSHIAENVAALGQMREFAETWRCPPDSPMNPVNKCFSVRDK